MHKRRRGISIGAKTRASPSLDPGVSARLWYPTGGFNAETRWSMHHFVRLEPGAIPALKPQLSIAVRTLAEHVLRCGDLRVAFLGPRRAQAGIAGHRKIQESRPAGYQPEVPVAGRVETDRFVLRIAGRIDGVWPRDDGLVVEEIKTTTRSLDAAADNPVHWGQAKIYAHLLAVERKLEMATVQLTYLHLDSGEVLEIPRSFTAAELESFFDTVVGRYLQWAAAMIDWRIRRDESIRKLDFPFSAYRPGQREMAVAVYRAVRDNHPLLVQAPTGIGKTLAAWFPAVKAMGEGLIDRVFYLTARTTGRLVAQDALSRLRGAGLRFRTLSLTAKDKICFRPEAGCSAKLCEFAKGHYDRLNDALAAAINIEALTRGALEAVARTHRVCPFDLAMTLAPWVDGIIGDYNYIFDPQVRLKEFFEEEDAGRSLILVDEAHNMVDRAREMYSAELSTDALRDVRQPLKKDAPALHRALGRAARLMAAAVENAPEDGTLQVSERPPEEALDALRRCLRLAETALIRQSEAPWRTGLMECYFGIHAFLQVAEAYDRRYATFCRRLGRAAQVRLFCIDPAPGLAETIAACAGAVFFSATLAPMDYFAAVLGLPATVTRYRFPSPFDRRHLAVRVARRVSTFYKDRAGSVDQVAEAIAAVVEARPGNYLAFFPSYAYLDQVHEVLARHWPRIPTRCQTPTMTEADRENFLEWLPEAPTESRLGFAVMGGVFGEGIDLVGDRLTGAVVVGVGLPAIGPEREQIRRYYEGAQGCGFDFAYRYPGINRVLQAAGRVIRSASDRGVVALIDARFARPDYRRLLPDYWTLQWADDARQLSVGLKRFWAGMVDREVTPPLDGWGPVSTGPDGENDGRDGQTRHQGAAAT
jgi:DNA excision repair protein ERCC-2